MDPQQLDVGILFSIDLTNSSVEIDTPPAIQAEATRSINKEIYVIYVSLLSNIYFQVSSQKNQQSERSHGDDTQRKRYLLNFSRSVFGGSRLLLVSLLIVQKVPTYAYR